MLKRLAVLHNQVRIGDGRILNSSQEPTALYRLCVLPRLNDTARATIAYPDAALFQLHHPPKQFTR